MISIIVVLLFFFLCFSLSLRMYLFIQLNYITNQFIDFHLYRSNSIIFLSGDTFSVHIDEVIYTGGTKKSVHISESRGVHKGGVQNKQNSLGGT